MKVTCDVIKDLIPLYIEGIASTDSAALVKEHIDSCKKCKIELEKMSASDKMPIDTNVLPLKKVRKVMQKKKFHAFIASIMLTLCIAAIVIGYLTTPAYFYPSKNITVVEEADGTIRANFDYAVSGYDIEYYSDYDLDYPNDGLVYHITAWDSIWNKYIAKIKIRNIVLNPDGDKVTSVYYYTTDGTNDVLKYGINQTPNGGVQTLPRLFLAYYASLAFNLAVICGIVLLIFRKNEKINSIMMKIFLLPISYLFAQLCIKGFTTDTYTGTHDFFAILSVALPLYIALIFFGKLFVNRKRHERNKQFPQ